MQLDLSVMRRHRCHLVLIPLIAYLSGCGGGGNDSAPAPQVPSITSQPSSTSVVDGANATFSVSASGDGISEQWQASVDGTTWSNISGATSVAYVITGATAALNGNQYRVVVTGTAGTVTSAAATLTVTPADTAPTIATQPTDQSASVGASVTFSVTAGGKDLTYQWQSSPDGANWTSVPGATSGTYVLAAVALGDNGTHYRVIVTNSASSVTSNPVQLTVTAPPITTPTAAPVITQQPANQSTLTPAVATFSVAATGAPVPTIQWQVSTDAGSSFSNINGATSATYSTPPTAVADNSKQFRAVASNSAGSVSSHPATLTVMSSGVGGLVSGIAMDGNGNLIVSTITLDLGIPNRPASTITEIRVITPAGAVSTLAGNGTQALANGTGSAASFSAPEGIALDSANNVYVADTNVNAIRKVTPGGVVTTFAGGDLAGGFVNGLGTQASFNFPFGVAVDDSGNIYVADSGNNAIRKITPAGLVSTLAGNGASGDVDGTGATATFNQPHGVAVDSVGNVYVADTGNYAVRKVTPPGVVTTLAITNDPSRPGSTSNPGSPNGITLDASGNVYVTFFDTSGIKRITPAGTVATVPSSAFNVYPNGITLDSNGNIYAGDTYNSLTYPFEIRKIAPNGTETEIP